MLCEKKAEKHKKVRFTPPICGVRAALRRNGVAGGEVRQMRKTAETVTWRFFAYMGEKKPFLRRSRAVSHTSPFFFMICDDSG